MPIAELALLSKTDLPKLTFFNAGSASVGEEETADRREEFVGFLCYPDKQAFGLLLVLRGADRATI